MPADPKAPAETRPKLADTVFSVVHALALIAIFIYGVIGLVQRNVGRFAVVLLGLAVYYALVLHKPVVKEFKRKRALKSAAPAKRS